MNFVLDTSVTMRWILQDGKPQALAYATKVLESIASAKAFVPVTWGLEVANILVKSESKGLVTEPQSKIFMDKLRRMDIHVDIATFEEAFGTTIHVARQYRLSVYDASYLELALRLGAPLATLDEALAKAARKAGVNHFQTI